MNNLRVKKIDDILITAIEGGINYWACVVDYQPDNGYAKIRVTNDETDHLDKEFEVSRGKIRRGLQLLKESENEGLRNVHLSITSEDYDSSDADACIQMAIFGDVLFG